MACKSLAATAMAFSVYLLPTHTFAIGIGDGGIPVYCDNCATATQNAALAITQTLQASTKIIQDSMNYAMRVQELNAAHREAAIENTRAAIDEDKKLGVNSLPSDACGVYSSISGRIQAASSRAAVRDDLARSTESQSRQSRKLPTGEPRKEYSVNQVLAELDEPTPEELAIDPRPLAVQIASNDPIPENWLDRIKRLINLLLIPYPVATPSDEQAEAIKNNGTPLQREQLAASLVMQRRQEVAAYSMDMLTESNVQRIRSAPMRNFIENNLSAEIPDDWGEKISENQLRELLHKYRVSSPRWYRDVATAEDSIALVRDQSMMMAEMLSTLWDIRQLTAQQLKQTTFESTREISQSGLQSR
jgi:hypothetical protein|tara:strand:- start:124 stop:1206 length:1083 start_codon:yes stop_codon:yes gene_type:complete